MTGTYKLTTEMNGENKAYPHFWFQEPEDAY
jgi:hypothetical protein